MSPGFCSSLLTPSCSSFITSACSSGKRTLTLKLSRSTPSTQNPTPPKHRELTGHVSMMSPGRCSSLLTPSSFIAAAGSSGSRVFTAVSPAAVARSGRPISCCSLEINSWWRAGGIMYHSCSGKSVRRDSKARHTHDVKSCSSPIGARTGSTPHANCTEQLRQQVRQRQQGTAHARFSQQTAQSLHAQASQHMLTAQNTHWELCERGADYDCCQKAWRASRILEKKLARVD